MDQGAVELPTMLIVAIFALTLVLVRVLALTLARLLLPRLLSLPGWVRHRFGSRGRVVRWSHSLGRKAPRTWAFVCRRVSVDAFTGLPLTLLGLTVLIMVTMFSELAEALLEGEGVVRVDQALLDALGVARSPVLVSAFAWITDAASNVTLSVAAVVVTGLLAVQRQTHLVIGLWVSIAGSQTMLWISKFAFGRPRPEFITDVVAHSPSFPSGHSAGAAAVYGFIGYAVSRLARSPGQRFEIGFWTVVFVVLVAFSRVFLHVHYPSDVLAGLLTGALWMVVGVAVAEWWSAARRDAPSGSLPSPANSPPR